MFLYGVVDMFCKTDGPPLPSNKKPPGPPKLPVDENIYVLLIIALFFGTYIIYNHKLKTKRLFHNRKLTVSLFSISKKLKTRF